LDIDKTMLDELTRDCKTPQDVEKLYSQMLQHMINRSLEAEMQAHLGHERYGRSSGNVRNGKSRKRVQSAVGELQIETPRDRDGTFEPQLLPKRQVRLAGMEENIRECQANCVTAADIEAASHRVPPCQT
jgi:putative transposase